MKRWVAAANVLTALRRPLATVFPMLADAPARPGVIALAAVWDVTDGVLARRYGGSRLGTGLDRVADKISMAAAFVTGARAGMLTVVVVVGVLLRDIVAVVGSAGSSLRRPLALPARAGRETVTVGQMFTLLAVVRSPAARTLAWATAAVGVHAIGEHGRAACRVAP